MTGMSIFQQACSLLEQPVRANDQESCENGLMAVNQIYSELWSREHRTPFHPLGHLKQRVELSWRLLPAMAYGVAMLLCLNGESDYDRYLELYRRAAAYGGGTVSRREDTLFREVTP